MPNTKWEAARRAWKILSRWKIQARRPAFAVDLHHLRRFINRLAHPSADLRPHYSERQFSFHDTPIFHLKLHRRPSAAAAARFHFPCINPKAEFDYEFESRAVGDDDGGDRRRRWCGYGGACDYEKEEEDGIDLRAEKFIKMFYEEMKMQNQVSYLPYDEFSDPDQ